MNTFLRRSSLPQAGYLSHVPLSGAELSLLPLLLRARLAQSLTMGAASVAADPGNAEYLLATQRWGAGPPVAALTCALYTPAPHPIVLN